MPKKTKKEKIIAELRRKLEATRVRREGEKWVHEVRGEKESTTSPTSIPTSHIPPALPTSYIIKDLQKTFLLAGLAISLELVVYWLTELGGSKFFQFLPIK